MNNPQIRSAMDRALDRLLIWQEADGEIPVTRLFARKGTWEQTREHCIFAATHLVQSLHTLADPRAKTLLERAAEFLLRQQVRPGVWSFSAARKGQRIDPDTDDTACASAALAVVQPELALANEETLFAARDERGVFRTWIREPGAPNDVDAVVNANVVHYLPDRPETAAACEYLTDLVVRGPRPDDHPYYFDRASLHYALARAYRRGATGLRSAAGQMVLGARQLVTRAMAARRPQTLAMSLCALRSFGVGTREAARGREALLAQQKSDGSWAGAPIWQAPPPPQTPFIFWWSDALATAFAVEALDDAY